ncbi:hypothetical protein BYT27DRAFT_7219823 [Phlegmacium glaucopus]|nr:hypothetical protein BYT27DRAFT_7219823 [Phlegmacium glaucopus]
MYLVSIYQVKVDLCGCQPGYELNKQTQLPRNKYQDFIKDYIDKWGNMTLLLGGPWAMFSPNIIQVWGKMVEKWEDDLSASNPHAELVTAASDGKSLKITKEESADEDLGIINQELMRLKALEGDDGLDIEETLQGNQRTNEIRHVLGAQKSNKWLAMGADWREITENLPVV